MANGWPTGEKGSTLARSLELFPFYLPSFLPFPFFPPQGAPLPFSHLPDYVLKRESQKLEEKTKGGEILFSRETRDGKGSFGSSFSLLLSFFSLSSPFFFPRSLLLLVRAKLPR